MKVNLRSSTIIFNFKKKFFVLVIVRQLPVQWSSSFYSHLHEVDPMNSACENYHTYPQSMLRETQTSYFDCSIFVVAKVCFFQVQLIQICMCEVKKRSTRTLKLLSSSGGSLKSLSSPAGNCHQPFQCTPEFFGLSWCSKNIFIKKCKYMVDLSELGCCQTVRGATSLSKETVNKYENVCQRKSH